MPNMSFVENATWSLSPRLYASIFPVLNMKYKWPIQITYKNSCMAIRDKQSDFYLVASRPTRVRRYKFGIKSLLSAMLKNYCVEDLIFDSPPTIIDIGANIGEFSMGARLLLHPQARFICIEPDLVDYSALIQNIGLSKNSNNSCLNIALSNQSGEFDFYLNNDSGDSSLLGNEDIKRIIKIQVRTLDEIVDEILDDHELISLIKLEAEGSEPEVLEGATDTLKRTLYVTADLGPERFGETTYSQCKELLQLRGFSEVMSCGHRYLFKNDKFISTQKLKGAL